jgi:hypothetical protein
MNSESNPLGQVCHTEKRGCSPIHFYYIIGILVAIVIVLMSVDWGTNTTLANTLNFALGLTSLVLALVAIIYAFVANHSFSGTVTKIETAASSVKEETSRLEISLKALESAVKEIPKSLNDISHGITETQKLIAVSSQQAKQEPPPPPPANENNIQAFANTVIDYYMRVSSWNGLKVIYLCYEACQKKLKVDLKEWTASDPTISYDYAYGYVVASASANFMTINDDANGKIFVAAMPQPVAERIIPALMERLKKPTSASQCRFCESN